MRRWNHARVDEGVDPLDDELGAAKSQKSAHIDVLSNAIKRQERHNSSKMLSQHGN